MRRSVVLLYITFLGHSQESKASLGGFDLCWVRSTRKSDVAGFRWTRSIHHPPPSTWTRSLSSLSHNAHTHPRKPPHLITWCRGCQLSLYCSRGATTTTSNTHTLDVLNSQINYHQTFTFRGIVSDASKDTSTSRTLHLLYSLLRSF